MKWNNLWLWLSLFTLVRLLFIKSLPIFNDESAYLHWGKIITSNWEKWWFPLDYDGRQPGTAIMLGLGELLPLNALIAGRLVSIFFAVLTFIFTIKASRLIFKEESKFLIILLIFTPFLFFFVRLAFSESAMAAFSALLFYQALKLVNKQAIKQGIILGLTLAVGWWIKSTVLLLLLPISILFLILWYQDRKEASTIQLTKVILAAVGGFILLAWPVLTNQYFLNNPQSEIGRVGLISPMIWRANFIQMTDWLMSLLTPPVFLISTVGLISIIGRIRLADKNKKLLTCWVLLPLAAMIVVGKSISARYLVFLIPQILILASFGISNINRRYQSSISIIVITTIVLLGIWSVADTQSFASNYLKYFPASKNDFNQYLTGWTSGYGVEEAADYLKNSSIGKQSLVFVRQDNGNPEDAMFDYLGGEANIRVLYLPVLQQVANVPKDKRQNVDLYFVSRGGQYAGLEKYLTEIKKFPKPTGSEFVGVYRINI